MFETLSGRLGSVFDRLKRRGALSIGHEFHARIVGAIHVDETYGPVLDTVDNIEMDRSAVPSETFEARFSFLSGDLFR